MVCRYRASLDLRHTQFTPKRRKNVHSPLICPLHDPQIHFSLKPAKARCLVPECKSSSQGQMYSLRIRAGTTQLSLLSCLLATNRGRRFPMIGRRGKSRRCLISLLLELITLFPVLSMSANYSHIRYVSCCCVANKLTSGAVSWRGCGAWGGLHHGSSDSDLTVGHSGFPIPLC